MSVCRYEYMSVCAHMSVCRYEHISVSTRMSVCGYEQMSVCALMSVGGYEHMVPLKVLGSPGPAVAGFHELLGMGAGAKLRYFARAAHSVNLCIFSPVQPTLLEVLAVTLMKMMAVFSEANPLQYLPITCRYTTSVSMCRVWELLQKLTGLCFGHTAFYN